MVFRTQGYPRGVRRFLTPSWLGLHLLAITLFSAFLAFGWWQLQRAEAGNDRSWGYTFEWPVFACFVIVMWVKMIHDELQGTGGPADAGAAAGATTGNGEGAEGAEGLDARPSAVPTENEIIAEHEAEDPALAAYNSYLRRLNAQSQGSRR